MDDNAATTEPEIAAPVRPPRRQRSPVDGGHGSPMGRRRSPAATAKIVTVGASTTAMLGMIAGYGIAEGTAASPRLSPTITRPPTRRTQHRRRRRSIHDHDRPAGDRRLHRPRHGPAHLTGGSVRTRPDRNTEHACDRRIESVGARADRPGHSARPSADDALRRLSTSRACPAASGARTGRTGRTSARPRSAGEQRWQLSPREARPARPRSPWRGRRHTS